jgi:F420-0:gamma-glutamyl ligase
MLVTPIKTSRITAGSTTLLQLMDEFVTEMAEDSVLAVTSKVVSLCEGSVAPADTDREQLIKDRADYWLAKTSNSYGHHFTITNHTLIASGGIDHSNGGGQGLIVLWPHDPQATANEVRAYLCRRFGLQRVGVVITDSTSQPMRRGVTGISLAYSGFLGINDYIGTRDLFGDLIEHSAANISGGLAASAVFAMGEGAEQTPLCVLSDLPQVKFQDRDPTEDELAVHRMKFQDDLFAPFLTAVDWQPGGGQQSII